VKDHDKTYRWIALFVILIGTFMSVLSSSLVNLALTKMMSVFGVSLSDVTWIVTAYTLAMGAVIPITGFLSDTIGIKKLYIIALTMFTVGSALSGLAWSNGVMILFRIIQAIGGGLMSPVGMSVVYAIFPVEERGKALGLWGVAAMAAPALGPPIGGYILSNLDWRLLFYINVPIGIIGIFFAMILMKELPKKKFEGNFDIIGFASVITGISCTLYVVGNWSKINWNEIQYPILLTIGVFNLILFIVNELTHPYPLLDLRIMKIYSYSLSQIISGALMLAMLGGSYVLPLYLQSIKGLTAFQSGLIILPFAIAAAVMMPISGALFDKFGAKVVAIPGLVILLWASYQLALLTSDTPNSTIMMISTLRGIGIGLAMMPISTSGMNAVPKDKVGRASALTNTLRNILNAISMALISTIVSTGTNFNYARLTEEINMSNQTAIDTIKQLTSLFMKSGLSSSEAQASAYSAIGGLIQKQSYLNALNYANEIIIISVIVAIPLALLMRTPGKEGARVKKESEHGKKQELGVAAE
jgi:EmrB/QacA subfamily drug resistance transporter